MGNDCDAVQPLACRQWRRVAQHLQCPGRASECQFFSGSVHQSGCSNVPSLARRAKGLAPVREQGDPVLPTDSYSAPEVGRGEQALDHLPVF